MKNTAKHPEGDVKHTKDVIDIDAVVPDDNPEESLTTTDVAEVLKEKVDEKAPLASFPSEENKTDNDEPMEEKKK
jgi:hypothetical protein